MGLEVAWAGDFGVVFCGLYRPLLFFDLSLALVVVGERKRWLVIVCTGGTRTLVIV